MDWEVSDGETVDHDYYPAVPKRISKPWMYETHYPMTQPPDINYRRIILTDQVNLEDLLKDPTRRSKKDMSSTGVKVISCKEIYRVHIRHGPSR